MDKASLAELYELLHRQEQLLANKSFLQKLPDKGEKVKIRHGKILQQIEKLNKIDESCKLLSSLTISSDKPVKKIDVENFEWQNGSTKIECLDSDDDSEPDDPLAVIASASHAKKKIVHLKEEKRLITDEDLKEIAELQTAQLNSENESIDGHSKYIFEKTDKTKLCIKNTFKPYKTLKTGTYDPCKESSIKKGFKWEVTAATPPPSVHGAVKEISLQESLHLHKSHTESLKELQHKHAREKLAAFTKTNVATNPITDNKYRDVVESESESEESNKVDSDDEVHDEESKDGGVVFTVFD